MVAAYATAANAGQHFAINIVHAFQDLAVVHVYTAIIINSPYDSSIASVWRQHGSDHAAVIDHDVGAEVIDDRFASYRVLQKLIQRQMLQNTFIVGSRGPSRRPLDAH